MVIYQPITDGGRVIGVREDGGGLENEETDGAIGELGRREMEEKEGEKEEKEEGRK